jgi:hypothetical protein
MGSHPVSRFGAACGSGTEHRMLPEAQLWTEVILQAIEDLDRRKSTASLSAEDSARQWFASDDEDIGTFVWSCRVINVDPSRVRSALALRAVLKDTRKLHHRSLL